MPTSVPHRTNADHAIALMAQATAANAADPFRKGFLVELPAEGELLVAGDLHGNLGNLERIIKLANLPRHRSRHLLLQELVHEYDGREVCRSYRLVEIAARLKVMFPERIHMILGNHEFAEVTGLEIGKNGETLNWSFAEGLKDAYGDRWQEVKDAYCDFWRTTPLAVRTPNRLFISHSTPRLEKLGDLSLDYLRNVSPEEVFSRAGIIFPMLWGRDYRPESAQAVAERMAADVLVVGHMPCDDGFSVPNERHVILDCKDLEGRYALVPLDRPLTQSQVIDRIKKLYD